MRACPSSSPTLALHHDRCTMNDPCLLSIRRGTLYFARDVYERYFKGLDNVVLLRDGTDLIVLPVRNPSAGGYVIKLKNAAGDRAVQAADFFRENNVEDHIEMTLPAQWSDDRAALVTPGVFE